MDFLEHQLQSLTPNAAALLAILCGVLGLLVILLLLQLLKARRQQQQTVKHMAELDETRDLLKDQLHKEQIHTAKLTTLLDTERKSTGEKVAILEDARENMRLQFQSLAQRIFDEKSEKFGTQSGERLTTMLQPLQDQLRTFQRRIDDIQVNDVRERTSLKQEITQLRQLNTQITRETANLTKALRGDKKRQGNWGELVLERLLENCGLRKGQEYTVQTGFRNRENKLYKPDVILHLPDNRDIIIDSKVSLSAWERYINSNEEEQKQSCLKEHVGNIRRHIDELSKKDYTELKGTHSLDFVLMFIPIDTSYIAAYEVDGKLLAEAYEKRIIIVTPTTLLATLKTVENLWRFEHQNNNAKEIAERAAAIYDKLRGFLEEMEKIGKQLTVCQTTYDQAMNRLTRGRANLISQAGRLTQLGVSAKKKIPESITALASDDSAD